MFTSLSLAALCVASAGHSQPPQPQHINGEIVRVSPDESMVVIRVGDGADSRELTFKVGKTTRFWGSDERLVDNGLYHVGFKQGTAVWFQKGEGQASNSITELRLYNPNKGAGGGK